MYYCQEESGHQRIHKSILIFYFCFSKQACMKLIHSPLLVISGCEATYIQKLICKLIWEATALPCGRYQADMIWRGCVVFEHVWLCWSCHHLLCLSWLLPEATVPGHRHTDFPFVRELRCFFGASVLWWHSNAELYPWGSLHWNLSFGISPDC